MNNLQIRHTNMERIVRYLYEHDLATKQELCTALHLSTPTTASIIKHLTEIGLLKEDSIMASSGGRKPLAYSLVYDHKLAMGIDITKQHIRIVLINLKEQVLAHEHIKIHFENNDGYYKKLAEFIEIFIQNHTIDRDKILGVGIAFPGTMQPEQNMIEWSASLDIRNVPFSVVTKHIPYPVIIYNEAYLAGIAEVWKRENVNNALYISVNKGLGGAIIIKNEIYNGEHYRAGEFGHITFKKDGRRCVCGRKGCFDVYCGVGVLLDKKHPTLKEFFADVKAGEEQSVRKWREYIENFATGMLILLPIFDSDLIIGGELMEYIREYRQDILDEINRDHNLFPFSLDRMHFSDFGDKASAVGGAVLFIDEYLNK